MKAVLSLNRNQLLLNTTKKYKEEWKYQFDSILVN